MQEHRRPNGLRIRRPGEGHEVRVAQDAGHQASMVRESSRHVRNRGSLAWRVHIAYMLFVLFVRERITKDTVNGTLMHVDGEYY